MTGDNSLENKRIDKEWQKDAKITKLYAEKLNTSIKEAKKIKNNEAMKYRQYGVTDDNAIIKTMKLDKRRYGNEIDSNERIFIASMASNAKDVKAVESVEKRLMQKAKNDEEKKKYQKIVQGIREVNDLI